MQPETQKKLVAAMEKMASLFGRVLGCDGYDGVLAFSLSRMKESPAYEAFIRSVIVMIRASTDGLEGDKLNAALSAVGSLEKVNETFAQLPEPNRQTIEWITTFAKNLPRLFRDQVLPIAKRLPHRAGRSPSLTPAERASVRERVRKRVRSGTGVKEAQRQLAALEGIHLRTVQRICAEEKATAKEWR